MLKRLFTVFALAALCLIILLAGGLMLPSGRPGTALYVAAKSPTRFDDEIWSSKLPGHPTGDVLIYDGKLYLKVQTVYHHFIDDTVSMTRWTPEKISALLCDRPDLARYCPDSARPDGGIVWLKK